MFRNPHNEQQQLNTMNEIKWEKNNNKLLKQNRPKHLTKNRVENTFHNATIYGEKMHVTVQDNVCVSTMLSEIW